MQLSFESRDCYWVSAWERKSKSKSERKSEKTGFWQVGGWRDYREIENWVIETTLESRDTYVYCTWRQRIKPKREKGRGCVSQFISASAATGCRSMSFTPLNEPVRDKTHKWHTHTYSHTHTHSHTHSQSHTHRVTHTLSQIHPSTRSHSDTHTHTHTEYHSLAFVSVRVCAANAYLTFYRRLNWFNWLIGTCV